MCSHPFSLEIPNYVQPVGLVTKYSSNYDHPDSSVGRASAFGAGGRGFESRLHHTKGVKMVLAAPLLALALKGLC